MNRREARWRGAGWAVCALVVGLGAAACGDSNGPGTVVVPEEMLSFVPLSPTAPPLETMDTTFWAVRGKDRGWEIRLGGRGGRGTGKRFLELRINQKTLLRRPDGTAILPGDSVAISVRVDTTRYLVDFQPSGLEFNPEEPAELEIRYDEADPSFLQREGEFDLWRQERPGQPWVLVGSIQIEEFDEFEAELLGFTRYALAIGR